MIEEELTINLRPMTEEDRRILGNIVNSTHACASSFVGSTSLGTFTSDSYLATLIDRASPQLLFWIVCAINSSAGACLNENKVWNEPFRV